MAKKYFKIHKGIEKTKRTNDPFPKKIIVNTFIFIFKRKESWVHGVY